MTAPSDRTPQHVHCKPCDHVWVCAYMPMEADAFAGLLKGLRCPVCGGKDLALRNGNEVPPEALAAAEDVRMWLAKGERGISSETIVAHLTGLPLLDRWGGGHPHDGDDLRRCVRLLEAAPSLVPAFPKMATCSKEWAVLVPAWDELVALLKRELAREAGTCGKTYERMRQLLAPVDGCGLYDAGDGDWGAYERQKREWNKRSRRRRA
jgi:hypothetical protein